MGPRVPPLVVALAVLFVSARRLGGWLVLVNEVLWAARVWGRLVYDLVMSFAVPATLLMIALSRLLSLPRAVLIGLVNLVIVY